MAFSLKTYVGDGITTDFATEYPVIAKKDIFVEVDGNELVIDVDYTVINFESFGDSPTIRFNVAPLLDEAIVEQRFTNISKLQSLFSNGSDFSGFDLNKVNLQLLFAAQEADDRIKNYINRVGGNNQMNQNLDMNLFRVINLGIAVNDSDAIGFKQAKDLFDSIIEGSEIANPFAGEGYAIGQTAFSANDLTFITGFTFVGRFITTQYEIGDFPEFYSVTNGVYGIGGGFFELPELSSPESQHEYYTRLL